MRTTPGTDNFVKIMRHDFMDATDTVGKCGVFPKDEQYESLAALIYQAYEGGLLP